MIGFRDMTFCEAYQDCAKAEKCSRPLTPEVRAAARKWWGKDGAPIAVFIGKPDCHTTEANQCFNEDGDDMCAGCDCWKLTRAYCG